MEASRFGLRSTGRLLVLCALLMLVPLGLLAFLSVRLATDAVEDNAKAQVRSNAAMAVNTFQSGMASLAGAVQSSAQQPALRAASAGPLSVVDWAAVQGQLRALKRAQGSVATAFLATSDGHLRGMVPIFSSLQGADLSGSDWYRGVKASGQPYVSVAYPSEAPGHENVVAVAAPVRSSKGDGRITGILVATFDLSGVQKFVDYFSTSLGIEITITDQNGVLLARPGQKGGKLISLADDPLVAEALSGQSGVGTQESEQGDLLTAYAPIRALGWTATASVPERTAFAGIASLRSTVLLVAGILALVLLGGLALLARALRERERAEVAAKRSRVEAEEANQAKSEFLSRMSHELRTPLNAVLGFGQLLSMRELDETETESVEQILKGGQHLLALINEVLDISRIEAGRLQLSLEPVELAETINEAFDLVRPLAAEREIELAVESRGRDTYVIADRQRLSQALLNLFSNAIKYNHEGGSVRIAVGEARDEFVRIEVTDTGEGISADGLTRLFTPFERLGADERQIEGTGLGLALSKGLVDAMGGRMGVESRLGQGSTFWIELEASESPLAAAEIEPDALPELDAGLVGDRSYTILYIEDNLSNLKLVQQILAERPDVQLIPAMQGGLGLELAREHSPDLVLLDLHLPDIQGDEVLARMQADPELSGTPVVVLSADATKGRIERLLEQGVDAYLSKPIDVKQFLAVINEHTPAPVLATSQADTLAR